MHLYSDIEVSSLQVKDGNLTKRALLTFMSNILQKLASVIKNFVVTPIIIRGLGTELYGAWMMIQQAMGYLVLSDLRSMDTLRFTLSVRQHVDDIYEKRRQIGAAAFTWVLTLPIFIVSGILVVWAAPIFIRTAPENVPVLRLAAAIAVIGSSLGRLLSLPGMVLSGMNLDYKGMWLNALTILTGGGLIILAIWQGWGLVGVAGAGLAGIILASGVRLWVAKKALSWFGWARPTRAELLHFIKVSGWLFLVLLGGLCLNSSDFLVIGIVLGPSAAAVYATTAAVILFSRGLILQLLVSGGPGLAGLCGQGQWSRIEGLRRELQVLAIGMGTFLGVAMVSLNEAFLRLWVGEGFYAGTLTNLLLVLVAGAHALFLIDALLMDYMQLFRSKAQAMVVTGLGILAAGGLLTYALGMAGMPLGVFGGYVALLAYSQKIIKEKMNLQTSQMRVWARPLAISALCLLASLGLAPFLQPRSWLSFLLQAAVVGSLTLVVVWFAIFLPSDRRLIVERLKASLNLRRVSDEDEV